MVNSSDFISMANSNDSNSLKLKIDNNPFSINNNMPVITPNQAPLQQQSNNYLERSCTRSIKFSKICKEINIDTENYFPTNPVETSDTTTGDSEMNYISNSCNCGSPNVYLESIEFTEGASGTIKYDENKPNLGKADFSIRIPCKVSAFIVRSSVCTGSSCVNAQWWVDLKARHALPLSFLKNGINPSINGCFKNTSATVVACNSHVLPCKQLSNSSNLYYCLTDKDSYVSPYIIYLFSSNLC